MVCVPCDCSICRTSATYAAREHSLLLYTSKNTDTGKQVAANGTVYMLEILIYTLQAHVIYINTQGVLTSASSYASKPPPQQVYTTSAYTGTPILDIRHTLVAPGHLNAPHNRVRYQ